jgi:hypothetical protein
MAPIVRLREAMEDPTEIPHIGDLRKAVRINRQNDYNSLELLIPIAKKMIDNMDSDALLRFVEERHQHIRDRVDVRHFAEVR